MSPIPCAREPNVRGHLLTVLLAREPCPRVLARREEEREFLYASHASSSVSGNSMNNEEIK
jgi:hypothetical protein